jgi:ubiquinone/menaquinone biosynthesis C-methylase UbiE
MLKYVYSTPVPKLKANVAQSVLDVGTGTGTGSRLYA